MRRKLTDVELKKRKAKNLALLIILLTLGLIFYVMTWVKL